MCIESKENCLWNKEEKHTGKKEEKGDMETKYKEN